MAIVLCFSESWDETELGVEIQRLTSSVEAAQKHIQRLEEALVQKREARAKRLAEG